MGQDQIDAFDQQVASVRLVVNPEKLSFADGQLSQNPGLLSQSR